MAILRLTAFRVISRSCLPALDCLPPLQLPDFVLRGVKNFVKRLGVIGGGFLSFLLVGAGGGEDATFSCSCGRIWCCSYWLPWEEKNGTSAIAEQYCDEN